MKKTAIILFLSCFFHSSIYAQHRPVISFVNNDSVYDFGSMDGGNEAAHQFEIRNTGNATLIITAVQSANNSFKFKWSDRSVRPGKKAQILVTYDPKISTKTGSFDSRVLITSNATQQAYSFIHLKGTVVPSQDHKVTPPAPNIFPTEPGYERYNGDLPVSILQEANEQ